MKIPKIISILFQQEYRVTSVKLLSEGLNWKDREKTRRSASEINNSVPITLDKYTILVNVTASDDEITYNYCLTDNTVVISALQNAERMRVNFIENDCTADNTKFIRDDSH